MNGEKEINEIVELYRQLGNVKAVAKEAGFSCQKTPKILISKGEYHSDTADRINQLYDQGLTPSQISKIVKLSPKAVNSYLPYTRCIYKVDRSKNALKLMQWKQENK